jgi:hypothetical protein
LATRSLSINHLDVRLVAIPQSAAQEILGVKKHPSREAAGELREPRLARVTQRRWRLLMPVGGTSHPRRNPNPRSRRKDGEAASTDARHTRLAGIMGQCHDIPMLNYQF